MSNQFSLLAHTASNERTKERTRAALANMGIQDLTLILPTYMRWAPANSWFYDVAALADLYDGFRESWDRLMDRDAGVDEVMRLESYYAQAAGHLVARSFMLHLPRPLWVMDGKHGHTQAYPVLGEFTIRDPELVTPRVLLEGKGLSGLYYYVSPASQPRDVGRIEKLRAWTPAEYGRRDPHDPYHNFYGHGRDEQEVELIDDFLSALDEL